MESLRQNSGAVFLVCEGQGSSHILGHESDYQSVTFHLAKLEPALGLGGWCRAIAENLHPGALALCEPRPELPFVDRTGGGDGYH